MKLSLLSKVEKKDLVYWIIILISMIVVIITKHWGSNEDLVVKVGFAGTIASLILSTIAIIYSFIQSHDANSINQNLNTSIESLLKTTTKIDTSTTKLEQVEAISNKFNESITKVDAIHSTLVDMQNEICCTTTKGIEMLSTQITDLLGFKNDTINNQHIIIKPEDKEIITTTIVENILPLNKLFLYFSLKSYESQEKFNPKEFFEVVFPNRKIDNKELLLYNSCNIPIFRICKALDLLKYEAENNTTQKLLSNITMLEYSEKLREAIILSQESPEVKSAFNLIDKYFER